MAKLWGGRFAEGTDALVNRFNASIGFDQRLWRHDILGSLAHVKMLGATGIIPQADADVISAGLLAVQRDIETGTAQFTEEAEDVHMNIETLLRTKIGPIAGKLHTARSRNDQVATDLRLWLKDELSTLDLELARLMECLLGLAEVHVEILMPGLTHLQHAQPVRLSHHLLAYFWMLDRDRGRIRDAYRRADVLPLGSGALAGTTFPIDRDMVAKELGFVGISQNSLDAVSDRDFAIESAAAIALLIGHLSRFAEELVLWSNPEFGYITMGDNVTTGSSIMPQKKNPDVAELIRGKTGRVTGNLISLLTLIKGLPLAYNKDLQEDKEPLFDSVDTARNCVGALNVLLENLVFHPDRMRISMNGDFSTATDLADYLVRKGLPFRDAHEVVGKIVRACLEAKIGLEGLTKNDLTKYCDLFSSASDDIASIDASVEARCSPGGTARSAVARQIELAKAALAGHIAEVSATY